jgi:hypothetical protein
MEKLCKLLLILIENPKYLNDVFRFIINHSTKPLNRKDAATPNEETIHADHFFEWLSDFGRDFCDPKHKISLEGNLLWLSKKIVINLTALPEECGDAVQQVVEELHSSHHKIQKLGSKSYKTYEDHGSNVAKLVTELNLPGCFMHYLMYEIKHAPKTCFKNNKDMLRQFFNYLNKRGSRLPSIEEIYESMNFTWSMAFEEDGVHSREPWNQTWREYPGRFSMVQKHFTNIMAVVPTFRGQRNLIYDFFVGAGVEICFSNLLDVLFHGGSEKLAGSFRAAGKQNQRNPFSLGLWVAGSSKKNRKLRRWVLINTSGWRTKQVDRWASHLLLWADPCYFSSVQFNCNQGDEKQKHDRMNRVKSFMLVAAATENNPEIFDCQMSTWMDVVKNPIYRKRFLKAKPHLAHVLLKIDRLSKNTCPPDNLARAIVNCVDEYTATRAHKYQKLSKKDIELSKNNYTLTTQDVKSRLEKEACVKELEQLEQLEIYQNNDKLSVLSFEQGEKVSWIDIEYSVSLIKDTENEILTVRNSRELFIVGKQTTLSNIVFHSHPLSELRNETNMSHPLWGSRQDLVEIAMDFFTK